MKRPDPERGDAASGHTPYRSPGGTPEHTPDRTPDQTPKKLADAREWRRRREQRLQRLRRARRRRRQNTRVPHSAPRPPYDGPVIDVRDVHKTYQLGDIAVPALRGLSLRITQGEFVAIMGASGSGKSTLMNILGCLDVPTSGSFRLNGLDIAGTDEDTLSDLRNRHIGFVFQSYNLIPRTRAVTNVELPLIYGGLPRAERQQRALTALAAVGLSDRVQHLPSELSGGQQQRVAVARALVTNPAMILADEPTGNLDTSSTAEVLGIFDRLSRQGRTIVLITHEEDVARHARRLIRLRDGQIIADESPTVEVPA